MKTLITLLFICVTTMLHGQLDTIFTGTIANDKTGTKAREGAYIINRTILKVNEINDDLASVQPGYVIEKISTTYHARPGRNTGLTAYSGATAATVINQAIAALTSGGDIYFKQGIYTITASIVDGGNSDINLIFEKGAKLTAGNALNLPVIYLTSVSRWRVKGMEIDGNKANQTAPDGSGAPQTDGFWAHGCNDIIVSDAYIHDCGRFGANFDYSSTYSGIENSHITLCGWNGINLGNLYTDVGLFAVNNEVSHCSDVGITTYGTSCRIVGNYIHHMDGTAGYINSQWAIGLEGSDGTIGNNIISQNRITTTGTAIAVVSGRPGNIITDNMITNISLASYSGALIIYSANNTIKGNRITSTDADVVAMWIEGNNNLIQGNIMIAVRGIRTGDNCDNTFINANWFQCSTVGILIPYASNDNTRIIENDFDACTDDVDVSGTGTIFGNNVWKDGTYDNSPP